MTNPITERIAQHYSELTQGNRRLADYLLVNPDKILMLSTNEIAEACDVSKASVSRFIRKLGYQDHISLRNELLEERDKGTPMALSNEVEVDFSSEIRALESLLDHIQESDMGAITERLSHSARIKIIGYRNSYPVAMHFRQQLVQGRPGVELLPLPGQTIGEDIASIGEDDFVVVIGIRRRVKGFESLLSALPQQRTLLITDQTGLKFKPLVAHTLICPMSNSSPLDSYAVPMALISYLSNRVFNHLGKQAVENTEFVAQTYTQLGEIE
ncbi:MurR/RpiR family transcriptional regulator [Vibrio maritimus]|uniref:MurR/RpiR family transcriptional regulator n=1 Tax=Vibrio maritimus TaxID=990268 RepID=UPI0037363A49